MAGEMFVRLKPQAPKQGHYARRYIYKGQAYIHDEETGKPIWYRVSREVAEELRELKQPAGSEPLFDVCTQEEQQAIAKREHELRLVEMGMMSATVDHPSTTPPVNRVGPTYPEEPPQGRSAAVPVEDPTKDAVPSVEKGSTEDDGSSTPESGTAGQEKTEEPSTDGDSGPDARTSSEDDEDDDWDEPETSKAKPSSRRGRRKGKGKSKTSGTTTTDDLSDDGEGS